MFIYLVHGLIQSYKAYAAHVHYFDQTILFFYKPTNQLHCRDGKENEVIIILWQNKFDLVELWGAVPRMHLFSCREKMVVQSRERNHIIYYISARNG